MGNPWRADDGCGLVFIEALRAMKPACTLINAGSTPENYAGKIIKENPDTVLLVDAVHLGKDPGEYAVLNSSQILAAGFTTHDLSPKLFLDYLKTHTSADIYLLGIQPRALAFDQEMSEPVKTAVGRLAQMVNRAMKVKSREEGA